MFVTCSSLALLLVYALADDTSCHLQDPGAQVYYDLNELTNLDALHVKNFTFAFCRALKEDEIPTACKGEGKGFGYAAVESDSLNQCSLLGKHTAEPSEVTLLDKENKAEGVALTYKDENCKFTLNIHCKDSFHLEVPGSINRKSTCDYSLEMYSVHGCPIQCSYGLDVESQTTSLCSGKGVCGFDKTNAKARCFCDEGYTGHDCNTKTKTRTGASGSSNTMLLILLFLLAIGLVAVVVYLANQIKAYRNDAQNYMQIRGAELVDQMTDI